MEDVFLKKHNCDIYLQSYEDESTLELIKIAKPKKYSLANNKNPDFKISKYAYTNKAPETNIDNMYWMFRNIHNCTNLVSGHYDLYIRTRIDILYASFLNFQGNFSNDIYIPDGGDWRGGFFDMFAISNADGMKYYSSLFNYLNYYAETGVMAHPETMLRHHLLFGKDPSRKIIRFPYGISLLRQNREGQVFRMDAVQKNIF